MFCVVKADQTVFLRKSWIQWVDVIFAGKLYWMEADIKGVLVVKVLLTRCSITSKCSSVEEWFDQWHTVIPIPSILAELQPKPAQLDFAKKLAELFAQNWLIFDWFGLSSAITGKIRSTNFWAKSNCVGFCWNLKDTKHTCKCYFERTMASIKLVTY
jgi:hypothetical protein